MKTLEQRAAELAKIAFQEVTADPYAHGATEPWDGIQQWIDFELEGDSVNDLKHEFHIPYHEAHDALVAALHEIATLDALNAPFND